jgi:hypothetical protein
MKIWNADNEGKKMKMKDTAAAHAANGAGQKSTV